MDQVGSFVLRGWMLDNLLFADWVSPFGNPRIKACLAAPRGVSHAYYVLHRSFMPRHPPYTLNEFYFSWTTTKILKYSTIMCKR